MGLDTVELVMRLEEEYGIEISDDSASKIYSVSDLYRWVLESIREKNTSKSKCQDEPNWSEFLAIVSDQLGIPESQITPQASITRDLGVD